MTTPTDDLAQALRKAFALGQTYWQQADSEYTSQHRKADVTRAKFDALVAETIAAHESRAQPASVTADGWSECYGKIIRALAAIACLHTDDNERIQRDPVMEEVMRARMALDKFSKSIRGPIQPTIAAERLAAAPQPQAKSDFVKGLGSLAPYAPEKESYQ